MSEKTVNRGWWKAASSSPVFWIILLLAAAVGFSLRGGSHRPGGPR